MERTYLRRGDVIMARQGANSRSSAPRPERSAVIISNDEINMRSLYVIVAWMVRAEDERPGDWPSHVPVMCEVPSVAMCEQITTLHRESIAQYVRSCSEDEMACIDAALLQALGLPQPGDCEPSIMDEVGDEDPAQADAQAALAERERTIEALNAELAAAHEAINRLQTAATKKPTPTQAALETAVLRAERDIYKSVADRLLDK